ncbi:glycerate kinase, partial [Pseudomonas aeruginosa]|uniref:glycerate kinase n=1 Tax=Pseudomonas aeruginosa TaxID=287 RepID=UPI0031B74BC8
MSPVPPRDEGQRSGDAVVLRSKNGIEIHLQSDDVTALGQSYLLTLPEERKDSLSLTQLRLNWGTPTGEKVNASWGISGDGKTAFIEMAAASGLELVPAEKRDPLVTTSRGT